MYANLGPGLEAIIDPPSPEESTIFYNHEYVAVRMKKWIAENAGYRPLSDGRSTSDGNSAPTSRDVNQFVYVHNRPVTLVDPMGLHARGGGDGGFDGHCCNDEPLATNIPFPLHSSCKVSDARVKGGQPCRKGFVEHSCPDHIWCVKCVGFCEKECGPDRQVCRPTCVDTGAVFGVECQCVHAVGLG